MFVQALAIAVHRFDAGPASPWACGAILLGAGTAMVYPMLLAVVGDVAHPSWRASAVGTYRLWRDAGFAAGAILTGIIADRFGMPAAIWAHRARYRSLRPGRYSPMYETSAGALRATARATGRLMAARRTW